MSSPWLQALKFDACSVLFETFVCSNPHQTRDCRLKRSGSLLYANPYSFSNPPNKTNLKMMSSTDEDWLEREMPTRNPARSTI